jgi:thiamine pyrophosphate-dependent acetolactate synthase large subunit-like protein
MLTGRTGPVHLDVPFNVFARRRRWRCRNERQGALDLVRAAPARGAVDKAAELAARTDKPCIIAGHGSVLSAGGA